MCPAEVPERRKPPAEAAVTGCPRGSSGLQPLPFPATAFIATPEGAEHP